MTFKSPAIISSLSTAPLAERGFKKVGFCLMLTGFSAAGKTELSKAFKRLWEQDIEEQLTVLDGDEVREALSKELGFSKEDRVINVKRLIYVSKSIVEHGGASMIAAIVPYEEMREMAKTEIEKAGGVFGLIHVSTPLAVCEGRDPKGWYKKAKAGEIKHFTGINDPYEKPKHVDVSLNMEKLTADEGALKIKEWLVERLSNVEGLQKA